MCKLKVAFVCVHNACRSQIAEALGISVNMVRERIAYGRSKLNALYERVYGEEGWK